MCSTASAAASPCLAKKNPALCRTRSSVALLGAFLLLVLGWVAHATPASAQVLFNYDYSGDSANEGFNDPTYGAARRTAFQAAGNIWGSILIPRYAGETITIHATFDPLGGSSTSATLGQAGASTAYANFSSTSAKYQSSTVYNAPLANHLAGSDLNGTGSEITAQFNSDIGSPAVIGGQNFYYGTDGNNGSMIDFETVALHEIDHGLGFSSTIQQNGSFLNGNTLPDAFSRFIYRGGTSTFLTAEASDTARAADITSDDLFFRDAVNGGAIRLFAPTTYQPGSSVSHTNDATYTTDLMDHIYPGVQHVPSVLDRDILSSIGWEVNPVPEPGTLALGALGLAATAGVYRRRAKTAKAG